MGISALSDVRALAVEAVQRRLVTADQLAAELARAPRRGSGCLRRALDDLAAGVRSAPEAQLRDLLRGSRVLPEPLWNPTLETVSGTFLGIPDGYCVDAALAFEVDSAEHHRPWQRWDDTAARRVRFAAAGVEVLSCSPRRIREEAAAVRAEAEATYLVRRRQRVRTDVRVRR